VAYLEQPSEFFIGRTVNVGVSGINMGSISPVDVGISVKVTPYEITPDHGKFKVEVIRSFFSQESGGTFAQSLTTFKQTVSATAAVDFGKTLILSGLYEAVETGASSKTPVLGDIPVVDTLFNARTRTERRDVALVLVTPRLAGTINTGTREFRSETLNRLLGVWNTLVDPTSGLDTVIGVLEHPHKNSTLFAPKVGDVRLPAVSGMLEKLIGETVAQVN
jgi:type II secretory pathway component GspD/PulD (secretin)